MPKAIVIYSNHPLSVVGDDDNAVIVIEPDALTDFDYLSHTVTDLLNADLGGPDVARLISDVCQRFLTAHNNSVDLTHEYFVGSPDFPG